MFVAILCPVTAPIGSLLRRNTRWAPAERFARRVNRGTEKPTWLDAVLLVGALSASICATVVAVSQLIFLAVVARNGLTGWHDLTGDGLLVASVVGIAIAGVLVTFCYLPIRLLLYLVGGFWHRTIWGRRSIHEIRRSPPDYSSSSAPIWLTDGRTHKYVMAIYAAGLVVLLALLLFIGASLIFQLGWPRFG